MQNGGKRPGAGRPVGSISGHTKEALIFKEELIKRVLEEKGPIIEALIKRAKKGDVQALKEINDRLLGKSSQIIDLGEETMKTITFLWQNQQS
jgi:hypothetical protein